MKISLQDAAEKLGQDASQLFIKVFEHGTMRLEYYKPGESDLQNPHNQDELYFISSGNGEFIHETERYHFKAGDILFVPAGNKHRFVNYSKDFATWVIFYGSQCGERNAV